MAQASAIIELLKLRVPLDEMASAMFVRGAPIGVEPVRKALYVILAAGGESWSTREADEDRADALVEHVLRRARRIPLVRHWTSRARTFSKHPAADLSDIVTAVVYAITTGSQPSRAAVKITAAALDINGVETSAIFERMTQISLHSLSQVAETVTLSELADAQRHLESTFSDVPDDGQQPNFRAAGIIILGLVAVRRIEIEPGMTDPT